MFYGNPWQEKWRDPQVIHAVLQGQRPERPNPQNHGSGGPAIADDVWKIIVSCWDQKPENRPTAPELVETLRALPDGRTYPPLFDDQDLLSSTQVFEKTYHHFSSLFFTQSSTPLDDTSAEHPRGADPADGSPLDDERAYGQNYRESRSNTSTPAQQNSGHTNARNNS